MSKIEWTDLTINPIKAVRRDNGKIGWHCEKVSPACANCYAEAMNKRAMPGCGTGLPYTVASTDLVTMWLDLKPFEKLARIREPKRVFVCSMTDMFGEFVPGFFITGLFDRFRSLPQHTFQILTKRPQRMAELAPREPLPHVQFGVTAEDQPRADERILWLLRTPAAKRFVSYEPALGPVDFQRPALQFLQQSGHSITQGFQPYLGIDWVIAGGESGPHARPANAKWFQDARDQCHSAGVPFFFKQWGQWCEWDQLPEDTAREVDAAGDGHYSGVRYFKSKGDTGRLLDGREWSEFPA